MRNDGDPFAEADAQLVEPGGELAASVIIAIDSSLELVNMGVVGGVVTARVAAAAVSY